MKPINYYELKPEENHFDDVVIDVTHRCNMQCKNCYIPNREIPDMDADRMIEAISKFPKKTTIRIIGAEPTMRKDLPELITRIKQVPHRMALLTNGLRLARLNYVQTLKNAGLRNVYLSMNGVDNDDWYEEIDELRCAEKKIQAMQNSAKLNILRDIGCIIVWGVNNDAPKRFLKLLRNNNIDNVSLRFKTIGQIGRHMDMKFQMGMDDLINLVSKQLDVSVDYIKSWQDKWTFPGGKKEDDTFYFPLSEKSTRVYKGIWIKLTNWNSDGKETVLSNSRRRGRLTEDFNVAPFFEHVTENEGGY
tara:strand:+ start:501 stop:1412 length:912 start_codon:yes stop_codon:yes gene_type:complete